MANMNPNKSVIIDCDPGIDDAAALFMALASDKLDVVALTTVFGNVGLDQTTSNLSLAKAINSAAASSIPGSQSMITDLFGFIFAMDQSPVSD
jgi:inosine-uridine nucleoside N-ribohydrolase